MTHPVRIEAAGIVLRPSGCGWVTGRYTNYTREGKERERIRSPRYTYRLARAVPKFLALLEKSGREAKGSEELMALLRTTLSVTDALENPGALLLEKRKAADLSQRQLHDRSGISRSCIQAIERGRTTNPKAATLLSLLWACER